MENDLPESAPVCACDDPLYQEQIAALKAMTATLNSGLKELQE